MFGHSEKGCRKNPGILIALSLHMTKLKHVLLSAYILKVLIILVLVNFVWNFVDSNQSEEKTIFEATEDKHVSSLPGAI